MNETILSGGFREVRGTFTHPDAMQDAVGRLSISGFDRADLTLPTETYLPPADTEQDARQMRTLGASTAATVAALAAAGVTVATGGAAAPVVAAAIAAGGVAGGAAHAALGSANNAEQESRTERARGGNLVLAVRTPTAQKQARAADILRAAGAEHVEIFNQETRMATTKSLEDLLLIFMQDIYYAERQILEALPKMAKAAANPQLQEAFTHHRKETQGQVERLEKAFKVMGNPASTQTCEAINGLIEEGEEVVESFPQGPVRDAGLVACAQAVEHYEMARYGSLVAWAKAAGRNELVQLFEETLAEEKNADTLLTQLASKDINPQAMKAVA